MKKNTNIVEDKVKVKVISFIDYMDDKISKRTMFHRELNNMRRRYIYKDISKHELESDIKYLKEVKEIIEDLEKNKIQYE
jgi:hypothetical protein